jgi:hypothetical protein
VQTLREHPGGPQGFTNQLGVIGQGEGGRRHIHRLSHHHPMGPCWPGGAGAAALRGMKNPHSGTGAGDAV